MDNNFYSGNFVPNPQGANSESPSSLLNAQPDLNAGQSINFSPYNGTPVPQGSMANNPQLPLSSNPTQQLNATNGMNFYPGMGQQQSHLNYQQPIHSLQHRIHLQSHNNQFPHNLHQNQMQALAQNQMLSQTQIQNQINQAQVQNQFSQAQNQGQVPPQIQVNQGQAQNQVINPTPPQNVLMNQAQNQTQFHSQGNPGNFANAVQFAAQQEQNTPTPTNAPSPGVPTPGQTAVMQLIANYRPEQVLSQDQLRWVFNRLAEIKRTGPSHSHNPEYNQLLAFLKEYTHNRTFANNQGTRNSQQTSAPTQTAPALIPQPAPQPTPQLATQSATQPASHISASSQPNAQQSALTASHLREISQQVSAYRYLSKNLPVPSVIQQGATNQTAGSPNTNTRNQATALASLQESDPIPMKVAASAIRSVQQESAAKRDVAANASEDPSNFLGFLSPYKLLSDPRTRLQRLLIPSITPQGLDPYSIALEREERLKARMQYRMKELENLPCTLSNQPLNQALDCSSDSPDEITPESIQSSKLKAVIELKSLRLLGFQKKLREEVLRGISQSSTLIASVDRNSFRRMKKQSIKEARHTEKLERQQRVEREKREKQKQSEFLVSILQHGKDLIQWHKTQQARQARVGKFVVQYHAQVEKEEQRRLERVQKLRLEALKAGNEQEYLKLIDQAKDTRISLLLQQTEGFLRSLTQSVIEQQNDDTYYASVQDNTLPAANIDDLDPDAHDADYFSIAHRIKEEITTQPTILVGGKLKEYQLKGLQWMVSLFNNRLNGILADEMGLGKTIQTISLITHLIEVKQQNGPYLVLVPLSTLPNWDQEFKKWAPSINKVVYKGNPSERKEVQKKHLKHVNFQVLLTTFEFVIRDAAALSKINWLHMVIDEGHRMKNSESKLSVTLNTRYSVKYRLILTGTPLQNNLPELWALLNFVLPRIFNSVKTFDEWFNTPFANSGGQDKIELNEEEQLLIIKRLHKVLRPFLLRRLKKDVESELPDKIEKVIKCKMSALQHKVYQRIQKREALLIPSAETKGKSKAASLNNTIMQLRKVCNHPFVFEDVERAINPHGLSNENLHRVAGKFELLDRILPKLFATGHRVLIFFQMTNIMTIFEDYLVLRKYTYLRLDGTTKQEDRGSFLNAFQKDDYYKIFMLSTRAGGLGLNLQTADTVIIFDSDWNPHQDLQAQDRAHRIGQKKKVLILRLITSNSVEEKILERAQYKLDIDGKVIQAGKFDNKSTAEEREAILRGLLEADTSESNGADEELNDEEMNNTISRSAEESQIFARMDQEREEAERQAWLDSGNPGPQPSRLIQEFELPDTIMQEPVVKDNDEEEDLGRGRRARGLVLYEDGLTEEQYLEAVENNLNPMELAMEKHEKRLKRQEKRRRQNSPTSSATSTTTVASTPDSGVESTPRSNKRSRRADGSSHRSKRSKADDSIPLHFRNALNQRLMSCLQAMERERDPEEPERRICLLFESKPPKRDYPDYYEFIKNPIAIKDMRKKINNSVYQSPSELFKDCMQMFENAHIYNEPGSLVVLDADTLEKSFMYAFDEHFPLAEYSFPERDAWIAKNTTSQPTVDSGSSDENNGGSQLNRDSETSSAGTGSPIAFRARPSNLLVIEDDDD